MKEMFDKTYNSSGLVTWMVLKVFLDIFAALSQLSDSVWNRSCYSFQLDKLSIFSRQLHK